MNDEVTISMTIETEVKVTLIRDQCPDVEQDPETIDLPLHVVVEREWSHGTDGLPWCEYTKVIGVYAHNTPTELTKLPLFVLTVDEAQRACAEARELAPTWSAEDFADDRSDLRD